jgi:hypothetical protein
MKDGKFLGGELQQNRKLLAEAALGQKALNRNTTGFGQRLRWLNLGGEVAQSGGEVAQW